jgi:hypothetical protein
MAIAGWRRRKPPPLSRRRHHRRASREIAVFGTKAPSLRDATRGDGVDDRIPQTLPLGGTPSVLAARPGSPGRRLDPVAHRRVGGQLDMAADGKEAVLSHGHVVHCVRSLRRTPTAGAGPLPNGTSGAVRVARNRTCPEHGLAGSRATPGRPVAHGVPSTPPPISAPDPDVCRIEPRHDCCERKRWMLRTRALQWGRRGVRRVGACARPEPWDPECPSARCP